MNKSRIFCEFFVNFSGGGRKVFDGFGVEVVSLSWGKVLVY